MPTTSKLVAALLMAGLGLIASTLSISYLPEDTPPGWIQPVTALIGLGVGWIYTGTRVQAGRQTAVGTGVISAVFMVFWTVFGFALFEMLQRAINVNYNGPMRAIKDLLALMVEYFREMVQLDVALTLAIGGAIVGALTGWVARRFR